MKAVIQAGGKGTRLRPYTLVLPKPMMPVGELPVIELLIRWLRRNGIRESILTTGYLGHLLRTFCGDGSRWDMDIVYTEEPAPLGTVGALDLLRDQLDDTFLVVNGDLVTDLSLRSLLHFHRGHGGPLTVGTVKKKVHVDMGVLDLDDQARLVEFREKPTLSYQVNMGLYCMEPSVLDLIPGGVPFGFDDLVFQMLDQGLPVHAYHHDGEWLDIGRPEDFQRAQDMVEAGNMALLGH